jgi:hypothetical protein
VSFSAFVKFSDADQSPADDWEDFGERLFSDLVGYADSYGNVELEDVARAYGITAVQVIGALERLEEGFGIPMNLDGATLDLKPYRES